MKSILTIVLTLFCLCRFAPAALNDPAWDIPTDEELDRVAAQLKDSATSMEALRKLIKYASYSLYSSGSVFLTSGDQQVDNRRRAAVKAIRTARTPEMVELALQHEDHEVRFWATTAIEADFNDDTPWNKFVPRLQRIAADDPDASVRYQAIFKLLHCGGGPALVEPLRESGKETDPGILMMLLRFDSGEAAARSQWYAKAVKHLQSKDAALRLLWLNMIAGNAGNPSTAEMWRIEADPTLVATLKDIERAGTEEERKISTLAIKALTAGYRWGQKE